MANKPPSFAALFRSPSCRRLIFVLCILLVVYFIFKVASSGDHDDKEEIVSLSDAYRTCIAKLGSVHAGALTFLSPVLQLHFTVCPNLLKGGH